MSLGALEDEFDHPEQRLTCCGRLRRQGAGYGTHIEEPKGVSQLAAPFHRPDVSLRGSDLHRTIEEMQLSLNLTSLRQSPAQGIDQLTGALLVRTSLHVQVI